MLPILCRSVTPIIKSSTCSIVMRSFSRQPWEYSDEFNYKYGNLDESDVKKRKSMIHRFSDHQKAKKFKDDLLTILGDFTSYLPEDVIDDIVNWKIDELRTSKAEVLSKAEILGIGHTVH